MKDLTYILRNLVTDRFIALTSLVALMLCSSSVAQANYFMYGTQDNCSAGWGSAVATESSSKYSIEISATTGHNYYVGYTGANASCDDLTSGDVTVDKSGCSVCSAGAPQEKGTKKYAYFAVSSNSDVTVEYDPSNNKYTITSGGGGGGGGGSTYFLCGAQSDIFCTSWCNTPGDCNRSANSLSLEADGYYTKTYRRISKDIEFRLHDANDYMTMTYETGSPTNLYGVTEKGANGSNLTLSMKSSDTYSKKTGYDFTIKYKDSKTYLITTPHIFFKGPFLGPGAWENYDYDNAYFEWTDISQDGSGNWVYTYDWTLTSACFNFDKKFSVCTATNEDDGLKLPNATYSSNITMIGVKRDGPDASSMYNFQPDIPVNVGDNMRLKVTRTGVENFTVELINLSGNAPEVRIGKQLREIATGVNEGGVLTSGYIASRGSLCSNVNKITIFYSNNSAFRTGGDYKSGSSSRDITPVTTNNTHTDDLILSASEVSSVVSKGETLYVRLKATNAAGYVSEYSDVAKLVYAYGKFVTLEQDIDEATACKGSHQFKWTGTGGMFNPRPDDNNWTVTKGDNDATDEFRLDGDIMIWDGVMKYSDNATADPVTHTYVFTAKREKDSYAPASETATFTLRAQKLDDVSVTIKQGGSAVSFIETEPWVVETLTAEISGSGASGVEWSNPENTRLNVSSNTLTAEFKGEKASTTPYEIIARPVNSTCGKSAETKVNIKVSVVSESCTSGGGE